ncbi:MAG: RIP metalloprotease RseP [Deltaproteobacteria bacterium]|nr:RIP metalloprotease RseP [Deltaproteobacteria bacterium]
MLSGFVAFIVVLGILIFVHELGHFLVAKGFRVGVEKFSLGFGPRLVGKKIGETEYCLSAIPLGGYVKMVGEDPNEPLSPEDEARSFNNQPLFSRFLIVAAGPFFNILFALIIFMGMFMAGYPSEDSTIGRVEKGSPAWEAGIRGGDHVEAVNGEPVRLWEELTDRIRKSDGSPLNLTLDRKGKKFDITVRPMMRDRKNIFGESEERSVIGISHPTLAPVAGVSDPASPAGRAGLSTGDRIVTVNSEAVHTFPELETALLRNRAAKIHLTVKREDKPQELTLSFTPRELQAVQADSDRTLAVLGISSAELFVQEVVKDSPAEKAGIKAGDRIVAIGGKVLNDFADLQEIIGKSPGVSLSVRLIRDGKTLTLPVVPEAYETKDPVGKKVIRGKIGILSAYRPEPGPTISVRYNPFKAFYKGLQMTWDITKLILVSLVKLIQHVIPADTIGGPILIAQLAGQQIQYGLLELLKFLALISINLGILNLFPIPILDGGHILFFAIEGLLGRPLSMQKREIAQQVGLFLLISLMIFAFYNDLMRVFK